MSRDYQAIREKWFINGQQRKIPAYGKYSGVKLMGILNYETPEICCKGHDEYDDEVFLQF
jgi:hypothetical protein